MWVQFLFLTFRVYQQLINKFTFAADIFSSLEPPPDMKLVFNKTNIGMDCDCYPSCSETRYDISVYTAKRFQNFSNNLP